MEKRSHPSPAVLVTGATGFVGEHLCQLLRQNQRNFRRVVRSSSSDRQDYDLVIDQLGSQTSWEGNLTDVDCIVHLAARVHVMQDTVADPLQAFREVNLHGTLRLAEAAAAAGVRRFIYLSSIKVNGEGTAPGRMFTEGDAPDPQDPYGVSKHEAEEALRKLAQRTPMEIVIIRPPLIYGPGVRANFLKLIQWVHRGIPLPLGSVRNRRSLIFVGNLADIILRCIDHPAAAQQTFLVSDGEAHSTPGIMGLMGRALGKKPPLLPCPVVLLQALGTLLRVKPQVQRLTESLVIDATHLQRTLGWKPPFTPEEGIRHTVEWYRSSLTTPSRPQLQTAYRQ